MLKKIKIFFAIAVAVMTLSSCLDKEPSSAIPEQEAMQTFDDAEQTLTGIYALMNLSRTDKK